MSGGDALVVFGLTGDLGEERLVPAIAALHRLGRLEIPVVGVGRSDHSDDDLRAALAAHDESAAAEVSISYVCGDAGEGATFDRIADVSGQPRSPVVYAALPPSSFEPLASALAGSGMGDGAMLVVEKPFGLDASSATSLHHRITEWIDSDRLFIVDHFLAKAAVENLVTVRAANPLFDVALRSDSVRAVHIEMHERSTAAGRGSFYDDVGVIADVVQNHVLQLATYALMPAPGGRDVRERRAEALASLTVRPDSIVLGQYDGYRDHDGVDATSAMPTFTSFELSSSLPRWSGTPIFVSAGKGLDRSRTRVAFELAASPGAPSAADPSSISFVVAPHASITAELYLLDPAAHGDGAEDAPLRRREIELSTPATHAGLDAYGTLLDDALTGRRTHFATLDDVIEGWNVVTPLVERMDRSHDTVLVRYPQGSSAAEITASGRTNR